MTGIMAWDNYATLLSIKATSSQYQFATTTILFVVWIHSPHSRKKGEGIVIGAGVFFQPLSLVSRLPRVDINMQQLPSSSPFGPILDTSKFASKYPYSKKALLKKSSPHPSKIGQELFSLQMGDKDYLPCFGFWNLKLKLKSISFSEIWVDVESTLGICCATLLLFSEKIPWPSFWKIGRELFSIQNLKPLSS